MLIKLAANWVRTKPPHELRITQDGFIECSILENFISQDGKVAKVKGSEEYNSSSLGSDSVPWVKRSYHKRGAGSFVKRTLLFSNGVIYSGNDATGVLTSRQAGFGKKTIPLSETIQVSGNSVLFFFTGQDRPYKYDGNGSFTFELTKFSDGLTHSKFQQGLVHLDRMWYVTKNSSALIFSRTLFPEDFSTDAGEEVVGSDSDSHIVRIVLGSQETMYVFKNNSIWQLFGRTPSTFQFRKITDKYGLAAKRGIYPVGSGFIFLDEFTKELYFFGGTESSIQPYTETDIRLREIMDTTKVASVDMIVHNNLFRFAFQSFISDANINDNELVFSLTNPKSNSLPKWSLIKDSNVMAYSLWNQQRDKNELVTGRSDIGKIMYNNRNYKWDTASIPTRIRTAEIIGSEDSRVRFKGFYIKGKATSTQNKPKFRYYIDGKLSDRGEHDLDISGVTRTLGSIKIAKSYLFNQRIVPFVGLSRGNSISFELFEDTVNTELEYYSISFDARPKKKIRNELS